MIQGSARSQRGGWETAIPILFVWGLLAAVLVFQWWFAVHHPILTVFLFLFEAAFDVFLGIVALFVTVTVLWGAVKRRVSATVIGGG